MTRCEALYRDAGFEAASHLVARFADDPSQSPEDNGYPAHNFILHD
jgi:hypothetical protein